MDVYTYTKIETRLANLLNSRRLRFPFINSETGDFKWKKTHFVLLNTLAGCLNIPVLFYMSFYLLAVYPALGVKPLEMVSALFFSAAISIFLDTFIGFFFDKLVKPSSNGKTNPALLNMLSIIGTIGQVVTLAFFFQVDVDQAQALKQFRATVLASLFFMTLANCSSIKHSVGYSPSQDDRKKVFHIEYFFKGFVIFLYVAIPLWAKLNTQDCDCGSICDNTPGAAECLTCLNTCDTFTGDSLNYFRITSIVFTCIFGIANVIAQIVMKTRNDEEREDVSTTFNRRLNEIFSNKFLIQPFFTSILEFTILFGFAIWAYYYLTQEFTISTSCTESFGGASYLCSKSFWLQLTVFLIFLLSAYIFLISSTMAFVLYVSVAMTILTSIAGILITLISTNDTTMFCFIAFFMAGFFGAFTATKFIYANGIFYDEYKSGVTQGHLPSSLFLLSIKLGFIIATALHLTLLNPEGLGDSTKNYNNMGFGIFTICASIAIFVLKIITNKNDIHAFDKVQIAIERNINLLKEDIAFYDPITKQPLKSPITSYHSLEKKLIRLMYNMTTADMTAIINGNKDKVQSKASTRMITFVVVLLMTTVLVIVAGSVMDTVWVWLVAIPLLYIPVGVMLVLYEYNVWGSVAAIDSSKYKNVDRDVMISFALLLEKSTPA